MLLGFLAGLLKKIDPGIEPDFISKFPRKSLSDLSDF